MEELSTSSFLAAFFTLLYLHYPEEFNPDSKISNTPQENLSESYDIVIVGGGTSGCVLANRLTESLPLSVLVIEAGADENPGSDNPLLFRTAHNTDVDWNYTTVPQPAYCLAQGGKCVYPRGHVLGGTSAIGHLAYVRGNRADYDEWAKLGNKGWGFKNVIKYFKRLEGYKIPFLAEQSYHGNQGPWTIRHPRYRTKLREEYIKAGQEFGWPLKDYNGVDMFGPGIDFAQLELDGPTALSTAQAYLYPAKTRKNLNIIKRSTVSKILLNKKTNIADGVEYTRDGKKYIIRANHEVILAAGAINTPKLLMLSGIGPKKELRKIGISAKCDLPVGKNFQDHPGVELMFELNEPVTITTDIWKTNMSVSDYMERRVGPLTTTSEEADAFFNVFDTNGVPNIQIRFFSAVLNKQFDISQTKPVITLQVIMLNPRSVGSVTLKSKNFIDPPNINPNYLRENADYIALERGIETVFDFMTTPTMSKYQPKPYTDYQPECADKDRDEFIKCVLRYYSFALSHPSGTASMGPYDDPNTVVSYDQLKVRCVKNLRVVDASVFPRLIRGHTTAATIMLAEKASSIIKEDYESLPTSTQTYADDPGSSQISSEAPDTNGSTFGHTFVQTISNIISSVSNRYNKTYQKDQPETNRQRRSRQQFHFGN